MSPFNHIEFEVVCISIYAVLMGIALPFVYSFGARMTRDIFDALESYHNVNGKNNNNLKELYENLRGLRIPLRRTLRWLIFCTVIPGILAVSISIISCFYHLHQNCENFFPSSHLITLILILITFIVITVCTFLLSFIQKGTLRAIDDFREKRLEVKYNETTTNQPQKQEHSTITFFFIANSKTITNISNCFHIKPISLANFLKINTKKTIGFVSVTDDEIKKLNDNKIQEKS